MKDHEQQNSRFRGWFWWCMIPIVAVLQGCTAQEENAGPGSPLYTEVVDHSVSEQNKRDGRGLGDGKGGVPNTSRNSSTKDRAMLDFIRDELALSKTSEVNTVYTYWLEDSASFLRLPVLDQKSLKADPDTYAVFFSTKDKRFFQVPYAKQRTYTYEMKEDWTVILSGDDKNYYVYWCDNHNAPHKKTWYIQDDPSRVPVKEGVADHSVKGQAVSGGAGDPPSKSVGKSKKDVAMLAFINNDQMAAVKNAVLNNVYVYWTEDFAEFRVMPPFKDTYRLIDPDAYFVYMSTEDRTFKQVPSARRVSVEQETKEGWGVTLSRSDNIYYVYWCNNHQLPHKRTWQIQDSADRVHVIEGVDDHTPQGTVKPAAEEAGDGTAPLPIVSKVKSTKDVAMLEFIRKEQAAGLNVSGVKNVYIYWTEDFAEFRKLPSFDFSGQPSGANTYFVYMSNQDNQFKQVSVAKRASIQNETQKGWGLTLLRTDTNYYVYWCNHHQQPHKKAWTIQDTPGRVPLIEGAEIK